MKLLILFILLSLSAFADPEIARFICGEDAISSKFVSPWKKEDRYEHCAKAECQTNTGVFSRRRCVRQENPRRHENLVIISNHDVIDGRYVSTGERVLINKENACFSSCTPSRNLLGRKAAFDKRECVECFKRHPYPTKEDVVFYPEIGRNLVVKTQCWRICRDREGPIQLERKLSEECQRCVGINGHTAESFHYLRTKSGLCLEIDSTNNRRGVSNQICDSAPFLLQTEYEEVKSLFERIMNIPGKCMEVDQRTHGRIFSQVADNTNCPGPHVNNSDRNGDERTQPATVADPAPNSGSRQ